MATRTFFVAALASAALAPELLAQSTIPQRQLGPATATTSEPLGLLLGARRLSDGRLLVDDGQRRRLLMFDAALAHATVLADTNGSTALRYGNAPSPIIAYLGDSTLFLDWQAHAFVVLDPNGKPAHSAALPKTTDQLWLGTTRAFSDPKGRLVYRGAVIGNPTRDTGQVELVIRLPDSIPVVRADFDTRVVDTAARFKLPSVQENHNNRQSGITKQTVWLFGLSWSDDWTMTSDGTVAIVRGHDYHIDWTAMDGTRTSTAKLPFDWQRVPDDEKRRIADSAAAETQAFLDKERAKPPRVRPDGTPGLHIAARADLITGTLQVMDLDAVATAAPLDRIPDFRQPFRAGTTLADKNGNVWLLPAVSTRSRAGGIVYDVVNRRGELVERVELPADRSILEFGPGDTVYLMHKRADNDWQIEVRRILR